MTDSGLELQPTRSDQEVVQIFITDGTFTNVRLDQPWPLFLRDLIVNGCVITDREFINRTSIVRMGRVQVVGPIEALGASNVIPFSPKGGT